MANEGIWLINAHGRRVHCLKEYEDELVNDRGYTYPAGEPSTQEGDESEAATEEPTEVDDEPDGGRRQLEQDIDTEAISKALASDNGNTMRSALADHIVGSTAGMGKPEIRDRLEVLLE
ncbi:MAG: hypothetical protein U5L04_02605 [Trueperaceae bacterium]|nr:hypothetical protein [Trueperaceae bacterium]